MPRSMKNKIISQYGTPVADYLEAKKQRDSRLWGIRDGKLVTWYNGEQIEAREFDKIYPVPLPVSFNRSSENPDKTKHFLL